MPAPTHLTDGSGPLTIGVDIGGTKVLAGVVDAAGTVLARERRATPGHSVAAVEQTIVELVAQLRRDHDVAAIGIGAAGFVDRDRSRVMFSPHLAWRDEPVRDAVRERIGLPVVVENDANAAGIAEARIGAGVGHRFVLCVTLGTGVGGSLVIDGDVYRGATGMAGEVGHMQVVPDGHRCQCGNRGCWEQYASGTALVREARELVAAGSPVADTLLRMAGGTADGLTGPLVTAAAREGDPLATELLEDMGRWLGLGLADVTAAFDPGCIVVGGGVSEAGELLLRPTREAFARQLVGRGYRADPPIVAAALGAEAGLVGASLAARTVVPG